MNQTTPEQKAKIIEMILSKDMEIRKLGMSLALNDGEWVMSLLKRVKATNADIIDFCDNSMDRKPYWTKEIYRFTYNDKYYELSSVGNYLSCFYITEITKEAYESRENKTNVD